MREDSSPNEQAKDKKEVGKKLMDEAEKKADEAGKAGAVRKADEAGKTGGDKKKDKAKKKAERQERRAVRRHRRAWAFFKFLLKRFFIRKFNYSYDSLKDIEGPYLLLSNHNMELDPALVGIAADKQLYFVASEHIMRKGLGTWFLRRYFNPIIHTKGKTGTKSVMAIIKKLKKGHNVCLFAEGNRSFNGLTGEILPSTGKLARAAGASLVTFRIEGGFLTQPRFSTSIRKGQTYGHLVHVYKPEELKAMTDDEMNEAINRDLYEDAYAVQDEKKIAYKGKNLTLGIESTLFYCPSCRAFNTLHSTEDEVRCDACGFTASYDEYGYLNCSDGVTRNMRDWDIEQKAAFEEAYADGTLPAFADTVSVRSIDNDHKAGKQYWIEITASLEGVRVLFLDEGKKNKRRLVIPVHEDDGSTSEMKITKQIPPEDLAGLAIYSRNSMNVILGEKNEQFDIKADTGFNALKYRYLYEAMQKDRNIKSEEPNQ